jgi:YD repeat-containing protein
MDDHRNGARHFELDTAGRVTTVSAHNWAETYGYDEVGNQTHATWPDRLPVPEARGERTYTGTRLSHAGGVRYEYDAAGRTILRQKTHLSRKPDTWLIHLGRPRPADRLHHPRRHVLEIHPRSPRSPLVEAALRRRRQTILEQVDFTWDGAVLCEQTTTGGITLTWDHQGFVPLIRNPTPPQLLPGLRPRNRPLSHAGSPRARTCAQSGDLRRQPHHLGRPFRAFPGEQARVG